nr:carboxypeptidase-like regulatory domain-containing protein [Acidobacteriota bacterium]
MKIIQEYSFDLLRKHPTLPGENSITKRHLIIVSSLTEWLALLILLSLSFVAAQAQAGVVHGQVVDQRGSAVGAARVTLNDVAKELKVTSTDGEGRFAFSGVAAGRYRLAVTAAGFAVYADDVTVGTTNADPLKIALNVETLKNEVEVTTERGALSLDAGTNASAIVLRGDMLKRLPHNEQQLMRMLERMSGSFAGKLDVSVNGLAGASLPPLATIKEIRINNDPFAASFHEPGSARVEIETKGGAEQVQASVYLNYRHSALDARNAFSLVKSPLEYRDLGAWWSSKLFGPRSFIFGLVERQRHDDNVPVTAYLPGGQFNANVPTPGRNTLINLRTDFLPSDRHTFSLLLNLNQGRQNGSEITSLDLPERSFDTRPVEQSLQASWRAILSSRMVNEAQIRIVRERASSTTDNAAAAIEVAGAFNGGGPQCCPERSAAERLSLADNMSFSAGRHFLKTGISITGAHLS